MKKSKLANIIVLSLAIVFCILDFIMVLGCEESSIKAVFINLTLVSLASLIAALVMVVLSKKKLIMIPMLVLFLNAFLSSTMISSIVLSSMGGMDGVVNATMDAFDLAIMALAILGIVFTCLKHKWGAIVGIIGVAFMIYTQNSLICGVVSLKETISPYSVYSLLFWTATASLFQFIWLLVPMISLLCEKKQAEEVTQVEEENY